MEQDSYSKATINKNFVQEDSSVNVLSCFDGMLRGRVALERAGIKVDEYFASEVDEHAIEIMQKNYPDTIQLGDISEFESWVVPKIDLVICGSSCKGFKFKDDLLDVNARESKLFFYLCWILKTFQPKHFLLENVEIKKEWQTIMSCKLGEATRYNFENQITSFEHYVKPMLVHYCLISTQNRILPYWFNWCVKHPEREGDLQTDTYKNIENGWTINALEHILRGMQKP